ncbi:hypothetical protein D3C73_1430230 [compost metagenome]
MGSKSGHVNGHLQNPFRLNRNIQICRFPANGYIAHQSQLPDKMPCSKLPSALLVGNEL